MDKEFLVAKFQSNGMPIRLANQLASILMTHKKEHREGVARGFAKEIRGDQVINRPDWIRGIKWESLND